MRHWTDKTDQEAEAFFDSLPECEIRRRQDLCITQIGEAWRLGKTDALEDLRHMNDALAASMMRRLAR